MASATLAKSGLVLEGQEAESNPGRFYRPELDVVRFLAFLLVFLHHTLPLGADSHTAILRGWLAAAIYNTGWAFGFGLSLFFTLSAFLICELLLRERAATGTITVRQFYIRRILRIWPLYFVGLAIVLAIALVQGNDAKSIAWTGWAAILLGNWFAAYSGAFPPTPLSPLWSISVEEQFYLMAPWAIKYLNRRLLSLAAVTIVILSNVWLFFLGREWRPRTVIWCNSFVQFENFAAGILLCLALHGRKFEAAAWQRLALLAVTALSWYYAISGLHIRYEDHPNPGSISLMGGYGLVAIGCCSLLLAFYGIDSRMLPGWAIHMGQISYGLYVFHSLAIRCANYGFPHPRMGSVVMLLKGACAFGLTYLMAWCSYRYFETPFLRMKKRFERVESRPV
jgi:peptidoglycan/LPS O-acetylase OafA/YrhL